MAEEEPKRKQNLTYEQETQIAFGVLVVPVLFLGRLATKGLNGTVPKPLLGFMILASALFAAYGAGRLWLWWRRRNAPD